MPILTAKQGTNADLFPDILALYVPKGSRVLDMTYGKGVFWSKVNEADWLLERNDMSPDLGDHHDDFRNVGWQDSYFDAVVLDPPYLFGSNHLQADELDGYGNNDRPERGAEGVLQLYFDGIAEAWSILRESGILIVKCQDGVESGKQVWVHDRLSRYAEGYGYRFVDIFVLVRNGVPVMRWTQQVHARKNHSYFLVFRKVK